MNQEPSSPSVSSGPLTLRANLSITGNQCVVEYEVQAAGPQAVYVYDLLPGPGTAGAVHQPDLAWVAWREPASALLVRATPPEPKTMDVLVSIHPLARRVDAGKVLKGRIALPLPLIESNPYFPPDQGGGSFSVTVHQVIVELEYLVASAGIKETAFPEVPGGFRIEKAPGAEGSLSFQRIRQVLACGGEGIPMRRRKDADFEPL